MQTQEQKQTVETEPARHWVTELIGKEAHRTAFVLGNGASSNFYMPELMKRDGVTIGCNLAFQRFPLDYLCWQDSGVHEVCKRFPGSKVVPLRKKNRDTLNLDSTYYFSSGTKLPNVTRRFQFGHTGLLAVQLAHLLGCNPIVLVGCDCCFIGAADKPVLVRRNEFAVGGKANIFADKHQKKEKIQHRTGNWTTKPLQRFADGFRQLIKGHLQEDREFFRMGEWGILDFLPVLEIEDYFSDSHPSWRGNREEGTDKDNGK